MHIHYADVVDSAPDSSVLGVTPSRYDNRHLKHDGMMHQMGVMSRSSPWKRAQT